MRRILQLIGSFLLATMPPAFVLFVSVNFAHPDIRRALLIVMLSGAWGWLVAKSADARLRQTAN